MLRGRAQGIRSVRSGLVPKHQETHPPVTRQCTETIPYRSHSNLSRNQLSTVGAFL